MNYTVCEAAKRTPRYVFPEGGLHYSKIKAGKGK